MRFNTHVFIILFPLLVWVMTSLFFVRPMRCRMRTKVHWMIVLLVCASRGIVYESLGGHAQAPALPEFVLWFWDWAFSGLCLLCLFSVVWWVRRGRSVLLPLLAWGIAALGFYNGLKLPEVRTVDVPLDGLPAELDGYRIAQLSDLHCSDSMRGWRTRGIVRRVMAARPDLICLTGDYVDGRFDRLRRDMEPLTELRAPDGVYAVTGNHEFFIDWPQWSRWYRERGFRFLVNECVFPRKSLALGGVNDGSYRAERQYGAPRPNMAQTFAAATNGEIRVLLQHRPRFAHAYVVGYNVRLMLSGHTHGGLVPGLKKVIARHNGGYVRGLYRIASGFVYVSPGVGQWSGFPLRLFDPPEISVLVLRKRRIKDESEP